MRSSADMEIIQSDITNPCIHNCSDCTRFGGLHIFNPGFLYEVGKNIFILNRRAAALKGKESLKLSELDLIWAKEKHVKLTVGELAGTTFKMKIKKPLGRLVHRAAFLFPEQ